MGEVAVLTESDLWKSEDNFNSWKSNLNDIFDTIIEDEYCDKTRFFVNLLLTENNEIMNLNNKFRSKNYPTNVLSFPQFSSIVPQFFVKNQGEVFLGDIAMAYEKIKEESKEFNVGFFDRCSHLFVHGILHLLGMDHEDKQSEAIMENREIKILNSFGIQDPYILRKEI